MKTREIIDIIRDTTGVSQRVIASLINVAPNTLSNNFDIEIEKQERKSITLEKLVKLAYVATFFSGEGIKREVIYQILTLPVFPNLKGHLNSVATAIQREKYTAEILLEIAHRAHRAIKEKELKKNHEKIVRLLTVGIA